MSQGPLRRRGGLAAGIVLVATAACAPGPAESIQPPAFRPAASIQDVMQSFIDPAADAIWASVATVITEEGTTHVRPDSDDEWKALRREALLLVEATNLLLMDGREVGRAGPGPADLGIELESAEIRTLIDQDPGGWTRSVSGLYEVAVSILEAVNARDADRLFERGASLDRACEQCHSQFWYPE